VRDPGLQPERTAIAWSRTCYAVAVDGVLVVRFGVDPWSGPMLALGCVMLFAAAVFLYLSLCRRAALLGSHPRAPRSSFMGACAGCIGGVCVLQAVALALK
jgi:uncharacterized membrane protein YidH (DUF202 family)